MHTKREVDAEVARVIFKRPNVRSINGNKDRVVYDNAGLINGKPIGTVMGTVDVPEYSDDMNAAMEVWEACKEHGIYLSVESYDELYTVTPKEPLPDKGRKIHMSCSSTSVSLALAISRAAVMAFKAKFKN